VNLGGCPPEVASGLAAPSVRVSCPSCGVLAVVFVWHRNGLLLAWGFRPDGTPAAQSLVPEGAPTVGCACGACTVQLRVAVAPVAEAMARAQKGRPKRAPATLA
jgi:hypothetical protein